MGLVKHKKLSKTEYNSLSEKDEDTLYAVNENGDFSESNMDDSAELYIGDKKVGGTEYDLATETADGLMSADDKIKTNAITVDSNKNIVAKGFKGTLYGNADTATKVGHSLTITNGANSVVFDGSEDKVVDFQSLSDVSIPKFSRIEHNEISSSNIVQGSTSLNGEIVYIDNLHPLSDGFYWYATDGKYYKWWNTAHLFKDTSSFVTLPNKIFECGEDGQQYVFAPTSYNDDGTAKYGQLLKLTDILKLNDAQMLDVTYSELKNLVDNAKLIKGMQYRITDFVTTCNRAGSVSEVTTFSAGHPFDIIVTADDNDTLNANARVCLHEGDTYFANNKLSEWVIKYDIDNDTTKYQWANATNGRGVIYYMCDEFGNEAPYDFKNIRFNGIYTFNYSYSTSQHIDFSLRGHLCYENIIQGYYDGNKLILNNITHMSNNLDNGYIRNNTYGTNCHSNSLNGNCNGNKFGNNCTNNLFYPNVNFISLGDNCSHNTINRYIYYVNLGVYCSYITLKGEAITDSNNRVRYVDILKGVFGTEDSPLTISLPVNTTHQTTVAKNSTGVIKIYNEADLVGGGVVDNSIQHINTILDSVITGEELDNMDDLLYQISQSSQDLSLINSQLEEIINI